MSYFARRIDYAGGEQGCVALIEITKRKTKKPFMYVVYNYFIADSGHIFRMISCESKKEAKELFPYGYGPSDDRGWVKTTNWLYGVGVGGGYEIHPQGTWVKIRSPYFRKRKNKKLILRFGDINHILLVAEKELESLRKEYDKKSIFFSFFSSDDIDESHFSNAELELAADVEGSEEAIDQQKHRIKCLKEEIRFRFGAGRSSPPEEEIPE